LEEQELVCFSSTFPFVLSSVFLCWMVIVFAEKKKGKKITLHSLDVSTENQ